MLTVVFGAGASFDSDPLLWTPVPTRTEPSPTLMDPSRRCCALTIARWRLGRIAILLAACLPACSGAGSSPTAGAPVTPSPTVVSITVSGSAPLIGDDAQQFTATALLSDGTSQIITSQASWTSSNTGVATVSATGMVTSVGKGRPILPRHFGFSPGRLILPFREP
jgi:hypothetical protein